MMNKNEYLVPDLIVNLADNLKTARRGSPSENAYLHRLETIYLFIGDVLKSANSPFISKKAS